MPDYPDIEGWGADLDLKDRPAVPKERTPPRGIAPQWTLPAQQPQTIPVLVSNERPKITPVFGTSTPPSGVSGLMRRAAFRYGEGDLRHWLILFAADRVNVVEGLIDDVAHGHVPNIFKEMGWRAELRHRPVRGLFKIGVTAAFGYAFIRLLRPRPKPTFFQRIFDR